MRGFKLALLIGLVCAVTTAAADLEVPVLPIPVPDAPPIPGADGLRLSLDEAYALALHRNLGLQVGRYDVAWTGAAIREAAGIFDPAFDAALNASGTESAAASQLEGAQVTITDTLSFDLGLSQLLPTGTRYNVGTTSLRRETNSEFFFLNPSWSSELTGSVFQPLLEGFGTLVNRSGIVLARNTREQAATAFAQQVIDTLAQVEDAYWSLVAAREAVDVNQQSLDLARRLLSETQERVRVGTAAPIDTVQAEASAAARLQDLIVARNAAANAEDALKAVLGFDEASEWETDILTAEGLETAFAPVALADAIEAAMKRRPELHQQLVTVASAALRIKLARNQVLPRLDLQASYGFSGLGGDLLIEDPQTGTLTRISGGLSDALTQITDLDFPAWTAGISFSMPIGNNQAKARLAERRFEHDQELTRLAALQQDIILQVRRAVRALEDGQANIEAAEAARVAAERNLEAEQTKYANGLSTNFQVLEIQDDLALARLSELNARVSYRRAMVAYRVATGTLLEQRGVTIADPGTPDVPRDFWGDVEWLEFVDLKDAMGRGESEPAEDPAA